MTTNIQSFAGDVEVHSGNLSVKSLEVKDPLTKLGSNNSTYSNVGLVLTAKEGSNVAFYYDQTNANVVLGYTNSEANDGDRVDVLTDERANLMVYGNVYVTGSVHGDGSTLTGLVTTLQSVTEFGANTTQMVEFEHPTTGINVFSNVLVAGNVTALTFIGDGSQLEGIAANLQEIVNNGNVTSNTVQFTNATTAFITTSNVGIANSSPTADLCVGSNVVIDDDARDVLQVTGNVNCHGLFLQSVSILPGYGLDTVTGISNSTPNTISITNSTLSLITDGMAGIGIVPDSTDVGIMLHVDGHLRLGGPAATTGNEQMYLKSAGELTIRANDSDTTNLNTKLILQTGDTSNSNITMEGNTNQQFMTFGVGATERMRIEQDGNVGINVTSASYTLDVGGDIRFDGNLYQGDGPFVATPWTITGDDIYYTVADGSVGIGTATSGATFHTEGNVVINTTMSDSTSNGGVVIDGGIAVSGNVHTGNLYVVNNVHIQSVQVDATPDLASVCAVAATTDQAVSITNTTASTSVGSGALTVDGGVGVDGNLYVGGNLAFPTPAVATTAGNVITWNSTTGLLEDSGGLLANKFAVVSEQPPSALTANSTTVTDHGVYKLTTSGLATDSNTWNAFNGDASDAWTSLSTYTGTDNVYGGSVQLSAVSSTGSGEWLAVEFPYKTTLRHMKLTPAAVASYPGTANLYATNDSTSWTLLKEWSDVVPGSESEVQTVVVDASAAYKKFAIVPTKAAGASTSVAIERWQLFAESFAVDGGKVAMASGAITGGNTVVDQTGPHARGPVPLRKYPEVAMTSNVQGGYMVNVSSTNTGSSRTLIGAFDGIFDNSAGEGWQSGTRYSKTTGLPSSAPDNATFTVAGVDYTGQWVKLELPEPKVRVKSIVIASHQGGGTDDRRPHEGAFLGSNDDTNWELIKSFDFNSLGYTNFQSGADSRATVDGITNTSYYKYLMIVITKIATTNLYGVSQINELEYYGYEETSDPDTSVDTKITSQFNLPDTTGVKLYIDGDKGSTATDFSGEGHTLTENNASYDSTEKAWEFSSLSTSNVTMTSGELAMEGTHPHSVSLWFNAANVSSNATLFHVGTAAGEGDAKTAISLTETGHLGWIDGGDNQFLSANTWHNLVYATQGGGGVRTCYLDGRKLGDAQVQDTFGDYPEFAMTGYSEYGYTASASSEDGTSPPWKAFDNENFGSSTPWRTVSGTFSTSSPYGQVGGDTFTDTNGGQHIGHWIKIKMPHKLILNWVDWFGPNSLNQPYTYAILATNNETHWDLIYTESGYNFSSSTATNSSGVIPPADHDYAIINAIKAYDTFIFVVKTITGNGGKVHVGDIKLYGHKENDTTRFPVSSTVLKYPHVAMTGPAQRGYVASASSLYSDGTVSNYQAWKAFRGTNDNVDAWISDNSPVTYSGTSPHDATSEDSLSGIDTSSSGGVSSRNGSWLKIELPRKIKLTEARLYGRYDANTERIDAGFIYGSNNESDWVQVGEISSSGISSGNLSTYDENDPLVITSTDTTNYYKYFIVQPTSLAHVYGYAGIGQMEYYGTEEDLDVVARVGEGLDGKVANFRVYDKYLHEEQALELWDAQKDQFGRAESSVSVYRGHVGIGTTTPSAALTVMDEAEEMEEFPPRAMTDYETCMEGHGVFRASASSTWSTNEYEAFGAFNKTLLSGTPDLTWNSVAGGFSSGSDYAYTGTNSLGGISGEWLKLSTPYAINPSTIKITVASSYITSYAPEDFYLLGSVDDATWYVLAQETGETWSSLSHTSSINTTNTYKYFALVVTKTRGADNTNVAEMRVFGTRERGQSTLHDGSLTLTKNLTVPRIGPAFDADDTPRRDRLVVEYNTSTNPTANGTVKDTSGMGLDGLMVNGASYDATEKALVFDGTDDYVSMSDWKYNTGFIHSFSGWIKFKSPEESWNVVYGVGDASGSSRTNFTIWSRTNDSYFRTEADGSGSYIDHTFEYTGNMDKWLHMAVVKSSARIDSTRIYINGVLLPQTNATLADRDIALPNTPQNFNLNGHGPTGGYTGNVNLSNVKFYDTALTADEVKRLYDMGRCDEGHHVVNFSKTRVGIGLGDGEAPRVDLDVRGGGILTKGYIGGPYNGGTGRTSDLVIKQSGDVDDSAKTSGVRMFRAANDTNSWHFGVNSGTNFEFLYNNASMASLGRTDVSVLDFTGQHRSFVDGVPHANYENLEGLIVSANKNKYFDINEDITTGANAIQISQSLPLVSLSTKEKDKACFGVISGSEDLEKREYSQGSFVSVVQKQKGDRRAFINSVGEGAMWVVNTAGALESGDYITTSNVAGYGQKQESDSLKNYTVAKITMDCDFNPQDQPIQRIKQSNVVETHYTGLVPVVKGVPHEWVTTTVTADDEWSNVSVSPSDVTYAEWSNLEANVQNTYTLTFTQTSNVVYDVKYTKTTTANVTAEDAWDAVHIEPSTVTYAEYSNLEANVQNTYSLTYTMTTKVEATEAIYSNLSTEDKEFFMPTYYHMVEQTVDAEYPGAVKHETVTDRLENDLDEHGQLQWEDDPSGATEKAYKIRYLDAIGQQTDEANCVHRAAFVGCTYHCG